jgi:hypothetical protein
MFKVGFMLATTGLAIVGTGLLTSAPVRLPLGGDWHLTLFPTGVGLLFILVGCVVFALAAVRRRPDGSARLDEDD